jgi:hypothetical protein
MISIRLVPSYELERISVTLNRHGRAPSRPSTSFLPQSKTGIAGTSPAMTLRRGLTSAKSALAETSVRSVAISNAVKIGFTAQGAVRSAAIANVVAQSYIESQLDRGVLRLVPKNEIAAVVPKKVQFGMARIRPISSRRRPPFRPNATRLRVPFGSSTEQSHRNFGQPLAGVALVVGERRSPAPSAKGRDLRASASRANIASNALLQTRRVPCETRLGQRLSDRKGKS